MDILVDMHAKIMTGTYRRAKNELDDQLRAHRHHVLTTLRSFQSIAGLVLDESVPNDRLRAAILERTPASQLEAELAGAEAFLTGPKSDFFPFVTRRFSYLRQFAPTLLEQLDLQALPAGNQDLVAAAEILRQMNETGQRKVPPDAPTSFLGKNMLRFAENGGSELDRAGYECAVLTALRDEIKRGNVFIAGSRRYRPMEYFLMPEQEWAGGLRTAFFALSGLPEDRDEARSHLKTRLERAYDHFIAGLPKNTYANTDSEGR